MSKTFFEERISDSTENELKEALQTYEHRLEFTYRRLKAAEDALGVERSTVREETERLMAIELELEERSHGK